MPDTITLLQLHEALAARGVDIPYKVLSAFILTGDVAQQLRVGGRANRKEFRPETVEELAGFLPFFLKTGLRWSHAPEYLTWFRSRSPVPGTEELMISPVDGTQEVGLSLVPRTDDMPSRMAIAEATGRAEGLAREEEVLTAEEAAAALKCSVALLHRNVPESFRLGKSTSGKRWRKSEILRIGEGEKR